MKKQLPDYYLVKEPPGFMTPGFHLVLESQGFCYQGCLMPIGAQGLSKRHKDKLYYYLFSSTKLSPLLPDITAAEHEPYIVLVSIPVLHGGTLYDRLGAEGTNEYPMLTSQILTLKNLESELERSMLMLLQSEDNISQKTQEILTEGKQVINAHVIESALPAGLTGLREVLSLL